MYSRLYRASKGSQRACLRRRSMEGISRNRLPACSGMRRFRFAQGRSNFNMGAQAGLVKVMLSRSKIPLNLPLQRETFLFPLWKRGQGGFLDKQESRNQLTSLKLTLTLPSEHKATI